MTTPPVTLVVPAFNEERHGRLSLLLAGVIALQHDGGHAWQVVFVDDGSTDGTFARLLGAAHDQASFKVLRHPTRLGTGAALRTGFASARAPIVCTLTADAGYPPERLRALVALLHDGADVASGTTVSDVAAGRPLGRRIERALANAYARWAGQDAGTLRCTFRAYHRRVLETIRFRATGGVANAEILVRARLAGFRIHALPPPVPAPLDPRIHPQHARGAS